MKEVFAVSLYAANPPRKVEMAQWRRGWKGWRLSAPFLLWSLCVGASENDACLGVGSPLERSVSTPRLLVSTNSRPEMRGQNWSRRCRPR